MTWKKIEAMRETRLWVGQIIVPAAIAVATIVATNPGLGKKIADKTKAATGKVKKFFRKKQRKVIIIRDLSNVHYVNNDTYEIKRM